MLTHVHWIGGGPGAGKTTVARRLAAAYGLRLYDTDAEMAGHARRSTPEDSPELARFAAMDMDERWLNRSPRTMLDTFHWFRGEGFPLIVEDLRALPPDPPVVPRPPTVEAPDPRPNAPMPGHGSPARLAASSRAAGRGFPNRPARRRGIVRIASLRATRRAGRDR